MRKLIYGINATLDGCCDHTKIGPDAETGSYFMRLMAEISLLVYGRKTYQIMVPYWPDAEKDPTSTKEEVDFARRFNSIDKVVFSRTLTSAEDKTTRIVRTDLRDEILKLKQAPGKDIMAGGVDLPSQLIQFGLVDEYHIVVAPFIAGAGPKLMEGVNLPDRYKLKLVESKPFKSGFVALHYVKQ